MSSDKIILRTFSVILSLWKFVHFHSSAPWCYCVLCNGNEVHNFKDQTIKTKLYSKLIKLDKGKLLNFLLFTFKTDIARIVKIILKVKLRTYFTANLLTHGCWFLIKQSINPKKYDIEFFHSGKVYLPEMIAKIGSHFQMSSARSTHTISSQPLGTGSSARARR